METLILSRDERQAKLGAWIVTGCVTAILFLFLFFWTIITPIPPLPPNMDAPEITFDFTGSTGTGSPDAGGSSLGETGDPGAAADGGNQIPEPQPNVADNNAVTDDNNDNPAAPKGNNTKPSDKPAVNPLLQKLLDNSKKNKGKATVTMSGGGQGDDPYNSGAGGKDGPGVGEGNDPGREGSGDTGNGGKGGKDGKGSGRRIVSQPEFVNPTQEEGKVRIKLTINREGKVVGTPSVVTEGTTTSNNILRATATQKGKQIVFNAAPNDPETVSLFITIDFTLK